MGIAPVFVFFFLIVFFGAVGLPYDLVLFLIESVFELIYAAGDVFDFPLLDGHEDVFELDTIARPLAIEGDICLFKVGLP